MQNMTVGGLKKLLETIPDDNMPVIIPVISEENADIIYGFRYVRTAGILENKYEACDALCLNSSNGISIQDQVKHLDARCKKKLF